MNDKENKKIDMYEPIEQHHEYYNPCLKCSRYDTCKRMDPSCKHSIVTYC